MDPWTADFLANLAADLASSMLNAAGRRVRDTLHAPEAQQALQRSVKNGLAALLLTANPKDADEAALLDDIFRRFLRDPDVARAFGSLLQGHLPDMEELRYLFHAAGYDVDTLPAISFEEAMLAFEAAFVESAVQEPALQGTITAAHSLVQTRIQRDLLKEVQGLLAFLQENIDGLVGIRANTIIAENVVSGQQTYQMSGTLPGVKPPDWERHYLQTLLSLCDPLDVAQIDETYVERGTESGVHISDVFTTLFLERTYRHEEESVAEALTPKSGERIQRPSEGFKELIPIQAVEAIAALERLVILGRPGGGKSTLVNYCTGQLARRRLGGPAHDLPGWGEHFNLLPVRIILRRFAAWLSEETPCGTAGHVWDYLEHQLTQAGCREFFPLLKRTLLEDGGLIFFDGLDEVSASDAACKRTAIKEAIVAFAQPLDKCRIVVTCREYAYQRGDDWQLPEPDFPVVELALFKLEQIRDFAQTWYAVLGPQKGWDAERCRDEAHNLYRAVKALPHLRELAQYPLLLTLMAQVHGRDGYLPQDRADLYERAVNLLLAHWENRIVREQNGSRKVEPSIIMRLGIRLTTLRKALEAVAFKAHERQERQPDRGERPADIPRDELREALYEALGSLDFAEQVIAYVQQRAGLLQALETATYAFPHRTFQEYLAARYLMRQAEFDQLLRERVHRDPTWWREVFLLAAGSSRDTPRVISDLVDRVLALYQGPETTITPERIVWARLAAQALVETRFEEQVAAEDVPGRYTRTYQDVQQWLVASIRADQKLNPKERAAAGNRLAPLGDPRFRADAWYLPDEPLLGFVKIPEGPFLMGSDPRQDEQAYGDEQPQHERTLSTYYIARYPVTVAQFRAFVQASGHRPDTERCLEGVNNHPVVYVTWHDAVAYCQWLTERLQTWRDTPEPLATLLREKGWVMTLPSEAQWEKAAAAEPRLGSSSQRSELLAAKQRYPWGDAPDPNRANYHDTGIGTTSPVGCFPSGASPYGIEDLSGNVWEWTRSRCRSRWGDNLQAAFFVYPYDRSDGREDMSIKDTNRVLRGGTFDNRGRSLRCACRLGNDPFHRTPFNGFRITLSGPS